MSGRSAIAMQRMGINMKRIGLGAAALAILTLPAVARPEIKDNAEIFHRLLTTAIANEIRENCPTIEARSWRATFYVLGILRYARSQGFSMNQINAYKKDPSEQARLRREGYAYLDKNGVNRKKPTSYCPLGQREIKNKSEIGKLLKSR